MRILQLTIPDDVNLGDFDLSMFFAAKLYEDGKLSLGQAAKVVGVSKKTFMELLSRYGVSVFSKSVSDLHSDIKNA